MSKRAFSLLEIMIGMALGSLILMGLSRFSQMALRQMNASRDRFRIEQNLFQAREMLVRRCRGVEPEFWASYPRMGRPIHEVDHAHGAFDFSEVCPEGPGGACFTRWDLVPGRAEPLVYRVLEANFPHSVRLAPLGNHPPGIQEEIEAMGVLLFFHPTGSFCALVAGRWGDELELVGAGIQPWSLPEELPPDVEVVFLGRLELEHLRLEGEHEGQLVFQPWSVEEGAWQGGRRSRAQDLHRLVFAPCTEQGPDRFTLVNQHPKAAWLLTPMEVAGVAFDKEVRFVSVEF